MFNAGELVIYGSEGVCRITGVSTQRIGETSTEYYELIPVFKPNTSVLVPLRNEKLVAKMAPLLSREEIEALINDIPGIEAEWIENENMRKERYKEMIASGDRRDLICILKTLYKHRIECVERGRKLHACDERFFAEAADKLHCEIAAVLGISLEEAEKYITSKMKD